MTAQSLLILLAVTLAATIALSLTLDSSLRVIDAVDECYNDTRIPVETTLCSSDSDIIGDPRFEEFNITSQCRSLCRGQLPAFLSASHLGVDCNLCKNQGNVRPFVSLADGNPHICVPRHVCQDNCGLERPGCIYTGSCSSQICFSGETSNKTAQIQRYTYRGPGTIITVDNIDGAENGTLSSTNASNPSTLSAVLRRGGDRCDDNNGGEFVFDTETFCSLNNSLGDGREEASGQCRVVCNDFNFAPYEVVRITRQCSFCDTPEAEQWYTRGSNDEPNLCIPREVCIRECGPEGYGCVYTGSCMSQICFSGIDSKKPAVFTTLSDDGRENELFVNNSGEPVNADPPAFEALGREGNATSVPPELVTPSPSPAPSNSPTSAPSEATEPSPSPSPDESETRTIWVWLGPVVAAGALGAAVAIGLVLFVMRTKKAESIEPVAPPMDKLPQMPPVVHTNVMHTTAYSLPTPTTPVLTTPPIYTRRQ